MDTKFSVPWILVLLSLIFGCSGEIDKFEDAIDVSRLNVKSISILSPLRERTQRGESLQFNSIANFEDGTTTNFDDKINWRTSDPAIASIDGNGLVKALAIGSVNIIAEFAGLSDSYQLTVDDAVLTDLFLSPGNTVVDVCRDKQLDATGIYVDENNVEDVREIRDLVSWKTEGADSTIIETGKNKGTLLTTSVGTAIVTINLGAISNNGSNVLSQDSLKKIDVTTVATSLGVSQQQQYTALGSYNNGIVISQAVDITNNVTWNSSNTGNATIDSSGLLTAVSAGDTLVEASCGGEEGSSLLTVTDSSTDTLQFLFGSSVVTSITRDDTSEFELDLQSVSTSSSTTSRTEDATWSVLSRSLPDLLTVDVSNETNSKGKVTFRNTDGSPIENSTEVNGDFVIQAEYNGDSITLKVIIGIGSVPLNPGGQ